MGKDQQQQMRLVIVLLGLLACTFGQLGGGNVVGGASSVDTNDVDMNAALDAGMLALNAQSNSLYLHQLVRVVSATKQVVAGLKYTIRIEMGTSECFKTVESSSLDECPVAGDTEIHSLVVSDQPWLSPRFQLLSHNTEVDVVPAPMVGTPGSIDNAEENMLAALEAGMVLLNAQSNSLYLHQAIRVISATKQVVAGLKYTIQIEMGTSECFKTVESSSLDECPVAGDTEIHSLVVSDQPWLSPRFQLLSHNTEVDVVPAPMVGTPGSIDSYRVTEGSQ